MLFADRYFRAVEWKAVRETFRRARLQSGKSLRELKAESSIDPSTIHRIENIKKYPDYRCDLDTLDALVRSVGLTLSRFFAEIEGVSPASRETAAALPPEAAITDQEALAVAIDVGRALLRVRRQRQPAGSPSGKTQAGSTTPARARRR